MKKIIITLLTSSVFCITMNSCLDSNLNDDPDKIAPKELDKDNLWGTYLTSLQRHVAPEDQNEPPMLSPTLGKTVRSQWPLPSL